MNVLEKVSSYNLITNFIPGVILLEGLRFSDVPLVGSEKLGPWIILSYALGLISSRIGSLLIDPWLKHFNRKPSLTYSQFIDAMRSDPKLEVLMETMNGYRTFIGSGLLYFVILASYHISPIFDIGRVLLSIIIVFCFVVLFVFSYMKQFKYFWARVKAGAAKNGDA